MAAQQQDARYRTVLLMLLGMSAICAAALLLDITRPRLDDTEPLIGLLRPDYPTHLKVTVWWLLIGWCLAIVAALGGAVQHVRLQRRGRQAQAKSDAHFRLLVTAILTVAFVGYPVTLAASRPVQLLACVPSTAFAAWLISCMQKYRRIPGRVLLLAMVWGGLVAAGFGVLMNDSVGDWAVAFFHPEDALRAVKIQQDAAFFSAGVFEELGKGAGVAVLCIVYRRYIDDVVSGVVLGASVGLGFNLLETIDYMPAGVEAFQYYARQSLGIMASHVAFTAVVGAGIGLARQTKTGQWKLITGGFLAAIGGHYGTDALFNYFGEQKESWLPHLSPWADSLVVSPLQVAFTSGLFVLMYLWWRRRGVRAQDAWISVELRKEALVGFGGVTESELRSLLDPALRLYLRVTAFRRGGLTTYRNLTQLHQAQFDLAATRWHRKSNTLDTRAEDESAIRQRITILRTQQTTVTDSTSANRRLPWPA